LPKIERRDTDELFATARAGGRDGFAALVRMHQARVFGIALRMLMDRSLAQDLAQEVFLQLHHSIGSIESHTHLVFWLRQVTARRAIDRVRLERRGVIVALEESLEAVTVDSEEDPWLQRRLLALIGKLPATARAVMLLRYQEDLDPLDISRTLGIPINTVKSHLKRSLAVLRGQLSGLAPIDGAGGAA
jgi:RNA polymerase sigma-70 factor (ECF subfamily)